MNEKFQPVFLISLAILVTVILLPNGLNVPGRDSGDFLYIGQRILAGDVPYRDLWDHKPPLIFYINAFGLLIGGGTIWGVWLLEFAAIYFAAFFGFLFLKRVFGLFAASLGTIAWLTSLIGVLEGGNFTEEYALLCQFISIYLFVLAEEEGHYVWRGYLIGVLTALSFFLRQNLIGIGVAIVIYLTINRFKLRLWRDLINELSVIFLGFCSITLIVVGYFAIYDSLGYFWGDVFLYNFKYTHSTLLRRVMSFSAGLNYFIWSPLVLAVWCMAIANLYLMRKTSSSKNASLLSLTVIGFPVVIIFSVISGRPYRHYFIAWLPLMAVLISFLFSFIYSLANDKVVSSVANFSSPVKQNSLTYVKTLLISILFFMSVEPLMKLSLKYYQIHLKNTHVQAAEYVKSNSSQQDYLLVWGAEPLINYLSRRRAPTRFFCQIPFMVPGYFDKNMMEEFLHDIQTKRPIYIIDTKYEGPYYGKLRSVNTFAFIADYLVERKIGNWIVYRRKPSVNDQR